jgi:Domain of unknown function (DUF4377)
MISLVKDKVTKNKIFTLILPYENLKNMKSTHISKLASLILVLFSACNFGGNQNEKTMLISAETRPCQAGEMQMDCMLVKWNKEQKEWGNFSSPIEGFTYEKGTEYELTINEEKVENPPADGSSIKYTLVKINSQQKVSVAVDANVQLQTLGKAVLEKLQSNNFGALDSFVSKDAKLLFSPYGFIDSGAQKLSVQELVQAQKDNTLINWGVADGTGDAINLTVEGFFKKYVNDKNYIMADTTKINSNVVIGNSLNNLKQAFPDAEFIEYFCKGSAKNNEMDWGALRLVFKKENGKMYLVGVIHNQWTS